MKAIVLFISLLVCAAAFSQTPEQKKYMEALKKNPDSVALIEKIGAFNVLAFSTTEINSAKGNIELAYFIRNIAKRELGDVYGAINDLDKVIQSKNSPLKLLKAAYMQRGVYLISAGQKEKGCLDLSRVGELGEKQIYEDIKRVCAVKLPTEQ